MTLIIKYFGMAAEASGKDQESINSDHKIIQNLKEDLITRYPNLENINFKVAVNQTIVDDDHVLIGDEEIALLPPFAGG